MEETASNGLLKEKRFAGHKQEVGQEMGGSLKARRRKSWGKHSP